MTSAGLTEETGVSPLLMGEHREHCETGDEEALTDGGDEEALTDG
jgi:hypothetical protein